MLDDTHVPLDYFQKITENFHSVEFRDIYKSNSGILIKVPKVFSNFGN